jgi:glycosyltransferase involved in cell wall biosynthesis
MNLSIFTAATEFLKSPTSRADLHVHSQYSNRPSEWFLRQIGAPESYMKPEEIYRRCKTRGMDFVTISDHNCIKGALEIAHLPGTFISCELTTYFPEDGCKIHCLVSGITEAQFRELDKLRENIYDLRAYMRREHIIHTITHPLFRVNDRLTVEHVEKLIVLFNRFEGINGSRDRRAALITNQVLRNRTPQDLARLADRHGLEPAGPTPWIKTFTGGSDDHSGLHLGHAWTSVPKAATTEEYLAQLAGGCHEMGGETGGSLMLARSLYQIAGDYYSHRYLSNRKSGGSIVGDLLYSLANPPKPARRTPAQLLKSLRNRLVLAFHKRRRSNLESLLITELAPLFKPDKTPKAEQIDGQHAFKISCAIAQEISYSFLTKSFRHLGKGELTEGIQAAAALFPVGLCIAPWFASFRTQHKDEPFLQAVCRRFPSAAASRQSGKKVLVVDELTALHGGDRMASLLMKTANNNQRQLQMITCTETAPAGPGVHNFKPVGRFHIPAWDTPPLAFPPYLEIIGWLEEEQIDELIITTPGPLGLVALAAAALLGIRTTAIYHTDYPNYIRLLTQCDEIEELTRSYLNWFLARMDVVQVPSRFNRMKLAETGIDESRLVVMPSGVDATSFSHQHRDRLVWERFGVDERRFIFLWVGQVSRAKNLPFLFNAFRQASAAGLQAELVVVGDGPCLQEYQAAWAGDDIHFIGRVADADLPLLYASADAFVSTSTSDTLGTSVLEAISSGLPVIVHCRGGTREVMSRSQAGLATDITDRTAFAATLRQLAETPALAERFRQNAIRSAAGFNQDLLVEHLWNDPAELTEHDMNRYTQIQRAQTAGTLSMKMS